jgi:probable HAF family extracellular repeat protein
MDEEGTAMNMIRRLSLVLAVAAVAAGVAATPGAAPASPHSHVDSGRLIPLGSLGGGMSWAEAMNERGDVIGGSTDARHEWRAVVWWHGQRSPTALGIDHASPQTISERGHIVGRLWDGSGLFLWRQGLVTYLTPPVGMEMEQRAINDRDQIVGTVYDQNGASRAFLWQQGRLTLLPIPKMTNSTAVDINNHGEILGTLTARGSEAGRAVLWRGGRMITLGSLGGAGSTPVALNDHGQVIGNSAIRGSSVEHPFLWQGGRMMDLLAGTPGAHGRVGALTDTGWITGSVDWGDGRSRPALWRAGRMYALGVPGYSAIGWVVNDRGDVAGLSWATMEGPMVPFRWRNGRVTFFPDPPADIASGIVGIDQQGTIYVTQERTPGLAVLRSA